MLLKLRAAACDRSTPIFVTFVCRLTARAGQRTLPTRTSAASSRRRLRRRLPRSWPPRPTWVGLLGLGLMFNDFVGFKLKAAAEKEIAAQLAATSDLGECIQRWHADVRCRS